MTTYEVRLASATGAQHLDDRVDLPRVDQVKPWYCGAACSVMVLRHLGISQPQDAAYDAIHDDQRFTTEQLYSDPKGIVGYIASLVSDLEFTLADASTEIFREASDRIFRALHALKFPVITLVRHGDHWVVIDGIRYEEDVDGARNYLGVYVQNPWPKSASNLYVAFDEFEAEWLTPNRWGETWKNKLAVICDDQSPQFAMNRFAARRIESLVDSFGIAAAHVIQLSGANAGALAALASHGFMNAAPVAGGGATISEPIEVRDLDHGSSYYIAPLDAGHTSEFKDLIYVAYDAEANLLEITSMQTPLQVLNFQETEDLLRRTFGNVPLQIEREVYWARAYETVSRFDVFRRAHIRERTVLILNSGDILDQLTIATAGG